MRLTAHLSPLREEPSSVISQAPPEREPGKCVQFEQKRKNSEFNLRILSPLSPERDGDDSPSGLTGASVRQGTKPEQPEQETPQGPLGNSGRWTTSLWESEEEVGFRGQDAQASQVVRSARIGPGRKPLQDHGGRWWQGPGTPPTGCSSTLRDPPTASGQMVPGPPGPHLLLNCP